MYEGVRLRVGGVVGREGRRGRSCRSGGGGTVARNVERRHDIWKRERREHNELPISRIEEGEVRSRAVRGREERWRRAPPFLSPSLPVPPLKY